MKKIKKLAMLGAIALTSTVLFTACSSDEEVAVNPTFDGNAVKTAFTLSVGSVKNNTRMVQDAYQGDNDFNGMTDIRIYPALAAIDDETTFNLDKITLADFLASEISGPNGKIYNNVNIAVGTTDFLFYGTTKTKGNGELVATDMSGTDPAGTSEIFFDLVPAYGSSKTITNVNTDGSAVLAALNAIDAKLAAQITAASGLAIADVLTEVQSKLRNKITSDDYGVYAGSSTSIEALCEDLYNSLKPSNNTYTEAICDVVETYFNVTGTDPYTVKWKTDPQFPASINLPDGAVAVQYTASDSKFKYVTSAVDGILMIAPNTYVKPAELYYTINTKGMVRNSNWLADNLSSAATWTAVQDNYTTGAVTATTSSIILKDQIDYAVARLNVQAQIASGEIKDNGSGISGTDNEEPQVVNVTNGFDLTGILVGGQKQVDWKFTPVSSATPLTIYDGTFDATQTISQSGYSTAISTLVLETSNTDDINIALEFKNNGADFFGKDHKLIPAGTKFYLIAKLAHASATETESKVFAQDYTTTAKLTITSTSLKNAYNVIPDLRSPKLEFGLSVNLEWKSGHTYTQNFQ